MKQKFKKRGVQFSFNILSHIDLTPQEYQNVLEIEHYQQFQWFVEIVRLREGGSFGELALINDKPRAAAI